jgi:hypothetical protein
VKEVLDIVRGVNPAAFVTVEQTSPATPGYRAATSVRK